MRNKTTAFFVTACLLLCGLVQAQVETTVTRKKALLGVTNPVVQGNRILVGEDSNVAVSDVVIVDIRTAPSSPASRPSKTASGWNRNWLPITATCLRVLASTQSRSLVMTLSVE
jgi:hypothetical protein